MKKGIINILIVEDCSIMRLIIRRTLELNEIYFGQIFEAKNGDEGLRILNQFRIGLLILDLNMPVMDGEAMLKRLRRNPDTSAVPVLIVSTESNDKRVEFIAALGTGFVHKPFTTETLINEIVKILAA
jgi:two-component system, chemotaxis family, chemotaxis protein CheY